jgi:hypothetical protein
MTTHTIEKTAISSENPPVSQPVENTEYKYPHFIGHDLPGLTADQLLERAVRNARCRNAPRGGKHMRWVAVADAFSVGSGYSHALCRRYGLDPAEMVKR